jgi:hypothetical protein
MEKTSTLTFPQLDTILFRQMMAKKLAVPQILRISKIPGRTAQINSNPITDIFIDEGRTTWSWGLFKPCKATFFKSADPILNSTWPMAEKLSNLGATEPRANKQNAVKSVIISRVLGSQNLLLHSDLHDLCILNLKLAHRTTSFLLQTI